MVKKIEAEGEKEKELYEKFMCYCNTADVTLGKSISDADTKIPQLEADIKAATEEKAQLEADLEAHQADRTAANEAMAKATEIREKEAAAFAKEDAGDKANFDALKKALAAIEKGLGRAFLQTGEAGTLRKLVTQKMDMLEEDRKELVAFLSDSNSAPGTEEIVGIMKQLGDEMEKDMGETYAAEQKAIAEYEALIAAKKEEVATLTASIEEKLVRVGELGVKIATLKNDLEDTVEAKGEDEKMLKDLGKTCAAKTKEWEARCKSRSEELLALADTIKILNDDDALELFKKASGVNLVQIQVSENDLRDRALSLLKSTKKRKHHHVNLDFIVLALRGKTAGFEKVIKLMDEMVVMLKKEQVDDDTKKEYCMTELDLADDKKKEVERAISDSEKAITEAEEGIATVTEEIAALEDGIKALDKTVAEATEQRKEENEEYTALMASDGAAKELLNFAKNRLNKFYNPKLYKAPPKKELTDMERAQQAAGGAVLADVSAHVAPPPPPETAAAFSKKSEESNGVIAMIDMMIGDLTKEMTEAKAEEKNGQEDYESAMKDAAEKRSADTKSLADKQKAKAETEASMEANTEEKGATTKTLMATEEHIASLHAECDWLLQYFQVRKEARAGEIESLKTAKAVLSGADFSLVEMGRCSLRGA